MKIHTVIRKGSEHKVFCEDFLWVQESDNLVGAAVFDGCSTGQNSHFASALLGKIFKSKFDLYRKDDNIESLMFNILYSSIRELNETRVRLNLNISELLSTIIFSIYNKQTKELNIIVIGDGVFVVNGEVKEIDQKNMPDYLSYHIETLVSWDSFKKWMENFENKFSFTGVTDYSICSDGILSFTEIKEEEKVDPLHFLTQDELLIHNPSMLARKCNILENKYKTVSQDDLSIVRIHNVEE